MSSTAIARQQFVALQPTDLPAAQQGIATWCKAKIQALGQELREQRQNLATAKAAKWKHSGWANAVRRTTQRMVYYAKIKRAVELGYLIVPNFEVEVMAVRVQRQDPPDGIEDSTRSWLANFNEVKEELLPPGMGRYVGARAQHTHETYEATTKTGGKETHHVRQMTDYNVPDFPVLAIKPEVLTATERAMALRIFDRIGVVTGRKQDPVVVGELIDPRTNRSWSRNQQKRVTFFIAWWLDTDSL